MLYTTLYILHDSHVIAIFLNCTRTAGIGWQHYRDRQTVTPSSQVADVSSGLFSAARVRANVAWHVRETLRRTYKKSVRLSVKIHREMFAISYETYRSFTK